MSGLIEFDKYRKKHAEKFNVSRHLRNEIKTLQNNNDPKGDSAYHKRKRNCEERFADFDFMSANTHVYVAAIDRGRHNRVVLSDHH